MTPRLACALLVLWTASALAPEAPGPNFSGNWLFDKGKNRLSVPAPDHAFFNVDHSRDWFGISPPTSRAARPT